MFLVKMAGDRDAEEPCRFGAQAARLAGLVTLLWGWTPAQFWRATPMELAAILAAAGGTGDGDSAPLSPTEFARLKEALRDGSGN
jgi:hypothetical protein